MKIASFDKRLVAWIIDYIFYLLLAIGLDVFMEFFVIRIANFNAIFFLANIFVAHFVFFFIFNSLMMFLSKGQTLGTLIKKNKNCSSR